MMVILILVLIAAGVLTAGLMPIGFGISPYGRQPIKLPVAEKLLLYFIVLYPPSYIVGAVILASVTDISLPNPADDPVSFYIFDISHLVLGLMAIAVSHHLATRHKWYYLFFVLNILASTLYMLMAIVMLTGFD